MAHVGGVVHASLTCPSILHCEQNMFLRTNSIFTFFNSSIRVCILPRACVFWVFFFLFSSFTLLPHSWRMRFLMKQIPLWRVLCHLSFSLPSSFPVLFFPPSWLLTQHHQILLEFLHFLCSLQRGISFLAHFVYLLDGWS